MHDIRVDIYIYVYPREGADGTPSVSNLYKRATKEKAEHKRLHSIKDKLWSSSYTVTLRLGQLSPNVPPCSLKVMRFHTAIMVSSGTLKWNSSTLAKELKAFSLRGVRVKYSVTKRQSVGNRGRTLWICVRMNVWNTWYSLIKRGLRWSTRVYHHSYCFKASLRYSNVLSSI